MCSRRTPCRSTHAFWAPMATMRPSPVPKPVRMGVMLNDASPGVAVGSDAGAAIAAAAAFVKVVMVVKVAVLTRRG